MAIADTKNTWQVIESAIRSEIKQEVEKEFDVLKAEMLKRLDQRKNEICAGVVLSVMKYVTMETINDQIIVTIREMPKQ